MTEDRGYSTDDRIGYRGQRIEDRVQMAKDRRQRTEERGRGQDCPLSSYACKGKYCDIDLFDFILVLQKSSNYTGPVVLQQPY